MKSMNDEKKLEIVTLTNENNTNDTKKELVWESCCLRINSHAFAYIGQLLISILILTFSFIQLIYSDGDCNKSAPYIGLISFLMGKLLSSVMTST